MKKYLKEKLGVLLIIGIFIVAVLMNLSIKARSDTKVYGESKIVQVRTEQFSGLARATSTIPMDNTIPQKSEGTVFMTSTITTLSENNDLYIEVFGFFAQTACANCNVIGAIFATGTDAIVTGITSPMGENYVVPFNLSKTIKAGTTTPITYTFRAGLSSAGATTTMNSLPDGTKGFNGNMNSYIKITEISQ